MPRPAGGTFGAPQAVFDGPADTLPVDKRTDAREYRRGAAGVLHAPSLHRGVAVLRAGDTYRARGEQKYPSVAGFESQPARGQDAERVAVAEDEHPLAGRAQAVGDQRVHPGADVCGGLAVRAPVRPQVPMRTLAPDLHG